MNGATYIRKCLTPHAKELAERNLLFMQDGARCHIAKNVMSYFDRKNIDVIENWPAHSPDLNPIEQLWAYIDTLLSRNYPKPQSVEQLKAQVMDCWEKLPQWKLNNFVRDFGRKVKECKRNGGRNVK